MIGKNNRANADISYFGHTFFLLLKMLSCYLVYREKKTSQGRTDCVYGTPLVSFGIFYSVPPNKKLNFYFVASNKNIIFAAKIQQWT